MDTKTAKLLSIYVGESAKYKLRPFYEAIVYAAKRFNLSEAMVVRGIMAFGPDDGYIHTAKLFSLSEDLPIKIEIIDVAEKIEAFAHIVEKMFEKSNITGLVTLQEITIKHYLKQ